MKAQPTLNTILVAFCATVVPIAAMAQNCDETVMQTKMFRRVSDESWELFRTGRFHPALAKSEEALTLAQKAFTKKSWQYVRATNEFFTIQKATKLAPVDQAALEEVLDGMGRQHRQIKGGSAEVAEKVGPDLLAKCDKLLGIDSYLSDLELDLLCQSLSATGNWKEERRVLRSRLERLDRNRMSGDPDLILCRMLLATNSFSSAEEIWSAGIQFNVCLRECRMHTEHTQLLGFVSLQCAIFLNNMDSPLRSLEFAEEGRKLMGDELTGLQRVEVGRICALALAHSGRERQANAELDAIEPLVKDSAVAVKAIQELVRAEVYLASNDIPKATSSLSRYRDLTKGMKTSPSRVWSMLLDGDLAIRNADLRKAEGILEEVVKEGLGASKHDHPRNLRPLKLLSQVKKDLGKSAEAKALDQRVSKLTAKVREAVETALVPVD